MKSCLAVWGHQGWQDVVRCTAFLMRYKDRCLFPLVKRLCPAAAAAAGVLVSGLAGGTVCGSMVAAAVPLLHAALHEGVVVQER
jgi:hypothetical protein